MARFLQQKSKTYKSFISSSGGNAGYSAAIVAKSLGLDITIVVPDNTLASIIKLLHDTEANIILHGSEWQEADQKARELVQKRGTCYIHPFDHPLLWGGHSTLIDECSAQLKKRPDAIALAVGGGGYSVGPWKD